MKINEEILEKNIVLQSLKNPYYFGSIVEHIDLKYFSNASVISVLGKMVFFYKEYKKHPSLSEIKLFLNSDKEINNFKKIVSEFKELDNTDIDIDIFIEKTEQFFKEKAIISTMLEVGENFKNLEHSEIADKFQKACNISIITDIGFDYFKDLETHINWLKQDRPKISTGFDFYDNKLDGGFSKEGRALYIWLGGTNSCKSMILGNLAANAVRQNLSVPIISLEMDEQLYAQRLSCNFSKIGFRELKNNEDEFREKINKLKEEQPDADLIFKEFPPGKLTISGLDSYLEKLKKLGKNFDLVFLDYITLMRSVGTNGMYEAGKQLAEDVRALSYKYEVSFVSVIQANRSGVSGQQPKLDNTSESMGIAHTSDFMASIWREEEDFETNTLRTGVIKNRIGENFGVKMLELDKYLTIREVDDIYKEDSEEMNKSIKNQIESFSSLADLLDE